MESFLNPSFIGQTIQTLVLVIGGFMALGAAKAEIRSQGLILEKMNGRIDRLEQGFIQVARQDERINAMDQRVLAQGKRIDSVLNLSYGRWKTQEENKDN